MSLYKILSIDGGGIRGIIPGTIMVEAEKAFGIKISDYFDMIAGTSTGGILACAYLIPDPDNPGKPQFSANEVVDLYFERGDEIFDLPFFHKVKTLGGITDEKYPDEGIEDALQDYFGELWLKDLLKPTVITSYDIKNRKGHFFRQHRAGNADFNFKVKEVCRATSAAPTYFECTQVTSESGTVYPLIDGGVFVNNPAMCAYSEARSHEGISAKDMKILSLSTGGSKKRYYYSKAKDYGMAQWVQPVIDIMMSGGADVAHFHLQQIFGTVENGEDQYLRIDEKLPKGMNPEMDCATPENMEALQKFGKQLFKNNQTALGEWFEKN